MSLLKKKSFNERIKWVDENTYDIIHFCRQIESY